METTERKKYYARTSRDELDDLRRNMMAKDHVGKVSNPDGGFYKSSEEIRAESAERLTRSEIINAFGEDLGQKLLGGGYASMSSLTGATDEQLLAIDGIGPASLEKIREVVTLDMLEEADSGLEEEAADESEVEEAVEPAVEAAEPMAPEEEDTEVSEEVLSDEPPKGVEPAPVPAGTISPSATAVDDSPKFGEEGAMSVRVRANKKRAAEEEAERKRVAAIQDAHAKPEAVPFELGSVDVDFMPEPDPPSPEPEVEAAPEGVVVEPEVVELVEESEVVVTEEPTE